MPPLGSLAASPSTGNDGEVGDSFRTAVLPDIIVIEKIFDATDIFQNAQEEEKCRRMVVDELSEREQIVAARTSYAFWAWEHHKSADTSCTSGSDDSNRAIRARMAMREARRHLVGQGGDCDKAIERLKSTLKWREEHQIDLLKVCFSQSEGDANDNLIARRTIKLSTEDMEHCKRIERLIEGDLRIQKMAVRGHDKQDRPIIVKFCRESKWSTDVDAEEGFHLAQFYVAERAIAVAEMRSVGRIEKLSAMFDFSVYQSGNAPPVSVMIEMITALQANYPERLGKAVVLDAPFWMQAVMQLVTPFLAEVTRNKLAVLGASSFLPSLWSSGPTAAQIREDTVRATVDPEQAMSFMLPDAKLTSPIDVSQQLRMVPFYELYDSIPSVVVTREDTV